MLEQNVKISMKSFNYSVFAVSMWHISASAPEGCVCVFAINYS